MQSPCPVESPVAQAVGTAAAQPLTRKPLARLAFSCLILSALFWKPLLDLARLAAEERLYSHVLLVPVISIYLAWISRGEWLKDLNASSRSAQAAVFPALLGVAALGVYFLFGRGWHVNNYLSITTAAYVCFAIAGVVICLGKEVSRRLMFPICFLVFMIPFPTFVERGIEMFFQHTSAEAAHIMFTMTSTPVLRDGLGFKLPGMFIHVAEECSGIRSTLVLFITALIGGQLFLRTRSRKVVLALFVIPLAIIRNGFRIFTVGMLCVHFGPEMIHSWIHRRGGPAFFALSLLPFFGLVIWLWKQEKKRGLEQEQEQEKKRGLSRSGL